MAYILLSEQSGDLHAADGHAPETAMYHMPATCTDGGG